MAGKFELKSAKNGKFFFNLKASNGQIILSSEMYETRAAAENGIESVKKNAGSEARFERKKSNKGDDYFILKAGNGEPIGKSEMYASAASMENGLQSVMKNAPDAPVTEG
jgi:uncharacterized protein YegP (UPF0339 family)